MSLPLRLPAATVRAGFLGALAVAALGLTAGAASAADLYGEGYYPPPERSYSYDERFDAPYAYGYEPEAPETPEYAEPYGREGPPIRYTDRRSPDPSYQDGCVPRWKVRRELRRDGWMDLEPIDRGGNLLTIRARREQSGRVFLLDVDRCSGEIVSARRHYLRPFNGPYAGRRSSSTY